MIVGVSGYARTGKDTVGTILVGNYGFRRRSFAESLKRMALVLDPIIPNVQDKVIPTKPAIAGRLSELVAELGWEWVKDEYPEVRAFLQRLGTDAGRRMIDEDLWVNLAMKDVSLAEDAVFTDVRFPNEAQAIRDSGGVVLRLERGDLGPANDHPSEVALDDWDFDAVIANNGNVRDLHELLVIALRPWLRLK